MFLLLFLELERSFIPSILSLVKNQSNDIKEGSYPVELYRFVTEILQFSTRVVVSLSYIYRKESKIICFRKSCFRKDYGKLEWKIISLVRIPWWWESPFCGANIQVAADMKASRTYSTMWEKFRQHGKNSKYRRNEDTAYSWHLTFGIVDNPKILLHFRWNSTTYNHHFWL